MDNNSKKYCLFIEDKILLRKKNDIFFLPDNIPEEYTEDTNTFFSLGKHLEKLILVSALKHYKKDNENDIFLPVKQAMAVLDKQWFPIIAKAFHLLHWKKQNIVCSRCGDTLITDKLLTQHQCFRCNISFFPTISPSIIVMIRRENKILMARSPHFPVGVYGLIAGFVEPGETLEEAVHRETYEEVGVKIKNIRYFGSQPWPFPNSLMIAFTADYDSGNITFHDGEIENADWYEAGHLPGWPSSSISIAVEMINFFKNLTAHSQSKS